MAQLDAACEAWLARVLADPPPLNQQQQDLISAAFAGALQNESPPRLPGAAIQRGVVAKTTKQRTATVSPAAVMGASTPKGKPPHDVDQAR